MALKSFEKYSMLFGQDEQYESSSVSTHSSIDLILHCLKVKSIRGRGVSCLFADVSPKTRTLITMPSRSGRIRAKSGKERA